MEPKQISCDQNLPSLSTRYQWFIAQNLESHSQILYTLSNPHDYYHCRINALHGRRIRACFHGWVILSNHPDDVLWSLWNPLTSNLIRLPPLIHDEDDSHECCLSAPPGDQASVLLLFSYNTHTIVFCRLDRKIKRLKWTKMSYAKQLQSINGVDDQCFLRTPTWCDGKVYATASMHYYHFVMHVGIVVKGKEVVISVLPFVEIPKVSSTGYKCNCVLPYLKGSSKELFYIELGFEADDLTRKTIRGVFLYTLDMTSMIWNKIVDLKDATFFLELASDYSACYYGSAGDSESGGYVHILDESGKVINSFHVKDRTMSVSPMPHTVVESQASAWAMLEWRSEVEHKESKKQEEDKDTDQIVMIPTMDDNINFDGTSDSHLLNIPIHILKMIMEHCIGIEYLRFRTTCKLCCFAAPPIQWSDKTLLKRLQTYSLVSPWLMVLDNEQGIMTFTDPQCGERYFIKTPECLRGDYQICCSRFGWLLVCKYKDEFDLALFNPLTSKILTLPAEPHLESFCFSAPPTSPDCMVVGFPTCWEWECDVYIHFVCRGETTWHLLSVGDDPYSFQFPTFIGRDVYALCNNKGVNAFRDIEKIDCSWEVVVDKAPRSHCSALTQYFLTRCDQHLLLVVVVDEIGESVGVFKLNESDGEWEKIGWLGKHMIYISDTSCICVEAKSSEMENKIYFSRILHNDETKIVFYSLETCRYHTFDDKNIQESFGANLFGTKYHRNPHTWVEPSWS